MRQFRRRLGKHTAFLGCVGVLVALVVCVSTGSFAADRICYMGLSQRLPIYPNAEIRSRVHNLFSEFGMGNTVLTLYTPDEPDAVRSWYGQQTGTYARETLQSDNFIERLAQRWAQGQWEVSRDESGIGTQIILFGTCAS
jgi:hypothetical protein